MWSNAPVVFNISFKDDKKKTHTLEGTGTVLVVQQDSFGSGSIEIENILGYTVTTDEPKAKPKVFRTARVDVGILTEREVERARAAAGVDRDTEFAPILDEEDNVVAIEFGWYA